MIRRLGLVATAAISTVGGIVAARAIGGRAVDRLLDGPRSGPAEGDLGPALDALGGDIVRLRSRDGLRLTGRWLPAEPADQAEPTPGEPDDSPAWRPDPRDAIVLLHGWSGSSAPDLVEYAPFLRRTAGVFGLDFRGHGGSDDGPTTFGLREIEDVAGALAWLGERGIERVALVGWSMGGIVAIASLAVLGDGLLQGADIDLDAPAGVAPTRRPRIVAIVADSVTPELSVAVGSRISVPGRRFVADRVLDGAARRLGGDPRETEPIRVIGLLEGTPILLIAGTGDETVSIAEANRLAAAAPAGTSRLIVEGAGHTMAHAIDPESYEAAVTSHLRSAFASAPDAPIIGAPGRGVHGASRSNEAED